MTALKLVAVKACQNVKFKTLGIRASKCWSQASTFLIHLPNWDRGINLSVEPWSMICQSPVSSQLVDMPLQYNRPHIGSIKLLPVQPIHPRYQTHMTTWSTYQLCSSRNWPYPGMTLSVFQAVLHSFKIILRPSYHLNNNAICCGACRVFVI